MPATSPYGRLALIANPEAGRGAMAALLPRLAELLTQHGLDYRLACTDGPGSAGRLAREAVADGVRFVVAAGGDGTVHEVLNGLAGDDGRPAADVVLGILPYGSGCDLVRTLGLPSRATAAAAHLLGDRTRTVDVGTVTYGSDGATRRRCFVNIAEAGLGATVVARAARMPAALGPARYAAALSRELPGYRRAVVRLDVDGRHVCTRALNVVVANARYFGGGMQIAPHAQIDDGLLDVLVLAGPKSDALTVVPRIYRGTHLPHRHIIEIRGRQIRLESDRPLLVEADGELLGTTPATFEVSPRAIRLKV